MANSTNLTNLTNLPKLDSCTMYGSVKDVLTVGYDTTQFDYLVYGSYLYIKRVVSYCPNYKEAFVRCRATIEQLDADNAKYQTRDNMLHPMSATTLPDNVFDSITIGKNEIVVVGGVTKGYRATFRAANTLTIRADYVSPLMTHDTIYTLLDACLCRYPKDMLSGKVLLTKQIRKFASDSLQKITGAFVMLTAGVILLTSYYNAYKILTQ